MNYLEVDTVMVLDRCYKEFTIRIGLMGDYETPIFDNLAAERFAREDA